jgi:hypothetical protein
MFCPLLYLLSDETERLRNFLLSMVIYSVTWNVLETQNWEQLTGWCGQEAEGATPASLLLENLFTFL